MNFLEEIAQDLRARCKREGLRGFFVGVFTRTGSSSGWYTRGVGEAYVLLQGESFAAELCVGGERAEHWCAVFTYAVNRHAHPALKVPLSLYTLDLEAVLGEMVEWVILGPDKVEFCLGPTLRARAI